MDHRLRAVRRPFVAGKTIAIAIVFAFPQAASAHSLVRANGSELTSLSADATSLNTLTVRLVGSDLELRDLTVDGGMDPGPCRPGDVDRAGFIVQTFCPRAGVRLLRLDAGDREDTVTAVIPISVAALGGEGADQLRTGPAADTLLGDAGDDTLEAGAGADTLDGGPGVDSLDAGPGEDTVRVRDGLADTVRCGPGADRVDADTLDELGTDCESVSRTATAPPPTAPGGRDRSAPRVEVGASLRQSLGSSGVVRLAATSSEVGTLAASGYVDVAGLALPLRSSRERITVAGGGADLRIRLSPGQLREARRALRRGRRVAVRLGVVATDQAGNSAQVKAPVIRLLG